MDFNLNGISEWMEEHRIPPWAGYAFLLLLGLAALFLLARPLLEAREYRFLVQDAQGDRVQGALVEVYDGERLLADGETGRDGSLVLRNLPQKSLRVSVFKRGLPPFEQTLEFRGRLLIRIDLRPPVVPTPVPTPKTATLGVRVTDHATKRPVPEAGVTYAYDEKRGTASTDSFGLARFQAPEGAQVAVRVLHPNYTTEALSLLAQDREYPVTLRAASVGLRLAPAPKGTLIISLRDSAGVAVTRGEVKLFEATTSLPLRSATPSADGQLAFSGLELGQRVYVTVSAPNFTAHSTASQPTLVQEDTRLSLTLASLGEAEATIFVTLDEGGRYLSAKVYVLPWGSAAPLAELSTSERANGSVTTKLSPRLEYYAVALSPGRLPARSEKFSSGALVSLTLAPATPENTANLTVLALSEEEKPLAGAQLLVTTKDGFFTGPAKSTPSSGLALFSLPKAAYLVSGHTKTSNASASVDLQTSQEVRLTFLTATAFASVRAFDAITGAPLPATVRSLDPGRRVLDSCDATAGSSCEVKVHARTGSQLRVESPGYANGTASVTLQVGETRSLDVRLVPLGFITGTRAELVGLFDPAGQRVDLFRPGGNYRARFRALSLPDVQETRFYLRLGDKASLGEEFAVLTAHTDAASVARSTTYSPGPQCADLNNNSPVKGGYKWLELSFAGGGSAEIEAVLQVSPDAPDGANLSLHYRALARFDSNHSRSPEDARFGGRSDSANLAGCYANTHRAVVPVVAPPEVQPSLGTEFTQSATISFNDATRTVDSSVPEITLQIDPVFPADALKLNMNPLEVLVEGLNSTANTTDCYRFDPRALVLSFASREVNPACPLFMQGDEPPSDSSASLTFYYARGPTTKLTLPIRVRAVKMPAFTAKPPGPTAPDTPRLIYATSNLQGVRIIKAEFGGRTRELAYSGPGVRVLALRGAGEMVFKENDRVAQRLAYQTGETYFEGFGSQGSYVESCESPACCAEGWCDQERASTAFSLLLRAAKTVSSQTAFRRGAGQPFSHFFPRQKFSLLVPFQAREGVTFDFAQTGEVGFSLDEASLSACSPSTPRAYELRLESPDGQAWNASASLLSLPGGVAYFGASCETSGLPLCGFLYGEGSNQTACIKRTDHTMTTALEQASPEHATPQAAVSRFEVQPFLDKCSEANSAYLSAKQSAQAGCLQCQVGLDACADELTPISTACQRAIQTASKCGQNSQKGCQEKGNQCQAICQLLQLACMASCGSSESETKGVEEAFPGGADVTAETDFQLGQQLSGEAHVKSPVPLTRVSFACTGAQIAKCAALAAACNAACQAAQGQCKQAGQKRQDTCSQGISQFIQAGSKCESTQEYVFDTPANLPTRAAWATCYPYGAGCKLACQPKKALAQLVPWQNQMLLIDRAGLSNACENQPSELAPALSTTPPNQLLAAIAQYKGVKPVENGFFGVLDAAFDPLSGTPTGGDTSRSERIPKKGKEFNPPLTDETTAFQDKKEHLQVLGGSAG